MVRGEDGGSEDTEAKGQGDVRMIELKLQIGIKIDRVSVDFEKKKKIEERIATWLEIHIDSFVNLTQLQKLAN